VHLQDEDFIANARRSKRLKAIATSETTCLTGDTVTVCCIFFPECANRSVYCQFPHGSGEFVQQTHRQRYQTGMCVIVSMHMTR
jgi:hypothetical protein